MIRVEGVRPGKVLLVGEPMTLFTARQEGPLDEVPSFDASVAGAELNVAVGLRRLGAQPVYMTKVGDDPFGRRILSFMELNGLDTSLVGMDGTRNTGFMLKSKVSEGDPKTSYFRKNSAASTLDGEAVDHLDMDGVTVLHLTGILPLLSPSCLAVSVELIRVARERGVFVSFDPNLRPALWDDERQMCDTLRWIAAHSDLVLPGIGEGGRLFGTTTVRDTARAFLDNGAKYVVVKNGARGAYATDGTRERDIPGYVVDHTVDTVGAGDGFAAGVLSVLLEGGDLVSAAERGNALGAIQTQHVSDNEGLPTPDELDAFIASHRRTAL
ncbi:sugar kinase [Bifidobacterium pullorum]|uniref:sugar kinase n=1 Tax=Bifidobacterium pullorum TaxID=78448 RepID=UPI0024AD3D7A|nr:sugar kinase [Bifidobacterium pullorum]